MAEKKITHVNEKKKSKDDEDKQYEAVSTLDQVKDGEPNESNSGLNQRKLKASSASTSKHSKEYPCPECGQSLASRFRYHTIPKLKLRDTVWIPTNNNKSFFIVCYTELGPQSDGILDELRRAEIGIRDGTKVFIIPLSCALGIQKVVNKQKTLPASPLVALDDEDGVGLDLPVETPMAVINGSSYRFMKSIRARMTVHKIIGIIRQQSSLTFDYVFFCVLASIIASLGLLENSTVVLVASMLVSPLMGPIMGFVIGVRVGDKKIWLSGLKCECIGIAVGVLTGFTFGLCTTWSETRWGSSESFPTAEMRTRGDYRRLWFGALVALPSGAAAALSVLGGNFGSLVGVAISASLLPPAVNTGLLFSYSLLAVSRSNIGRHSTQLINSSATFNSLSSLTNCTTFVDNDYLPLYSCDMPKEAGQLAVYSFVITVVNIFCICLMAVVVLLIKKVVPIIPDAEISKRTFLLFAIALLHLRMFFVCSAQFWKSDIKKIRTASDNKINNGVDGEVTQEIIDVFRTVSDSNVLSKQRKEHVV